MIQLKKELEIEKWAGNIKKINNEKIWIKDFAMKEKEVKDTNANTIEKCVSCGKETPYLKSTPIQQRKFYIVGVGQVCYECYKKLKSEIEYVESEE